MDNDDLQIEDIMRIAESGETIAKYPGDKPNPSKLVLGWINICDPVHIVCAADMQKRMHIITVYRPDNSIWDKDFRKKKKK
jgi:hypothetical protein